MFVLELENSGTKEASLIMLDGLGGTKLKMSAAESSWQTSTSEGCSTSLEKIESSEPMEASLMGVNEPER